MAKLPIRERQITQRAGAAPQLTTNNSAAQAVAGLAQGITGLLKIQGDMQQREARDYVIQSQNDTSVLLEQEKANAAQTSKTGSEYTESIKTFIEKQKQTAIDNSPNKRATDATGEYYNTLLSNELTRAIPVAARMNAANTARVQQQALQINFNSTLQDPTGYEENLKNGALVIATSDLPESQKAAAVSQYNTELSFYRFKGQIKDNPALALKELESGEWNSRLKPNQLDSLTRSAQQQVDSVKASNTKKISSEISDYVAYKSAGGEDKKNFSEANLKAIYGSEKGAEIHRQILDVESFAVAYNEVSTASYEDLKPLLESQSVDGPENFKTESAQQNMMVKAIQRRNAELAKDPSMYALKSDNVQSSYDIYKTSGDGTDYVETTLSEQARLGVPSGYETILPKQEATAMVEQYNQGGEDAGVFISQITQQFGKYAPLVLKDLTAAGLSSNAATVAILPQGGRAATYLAQADSEGLKVLNQTIDADAPKTIKADSDGYLAEYRKTIYNPSTYAQIKTSVELLATKYMSNGMHNSTSDALKAAASDVINDRYQFVANYRVPNDIDSSKVERGVDSKLLTIKDMDLMIPSSELPIDVATESYKERMIPKALTMNDDSGVVIVDQFNQPVLRADGTAIQFSWEEISLDRPEYTGTRTFNLSGL